MRRPRAEYVAASRRGHQLLGRRADQLLGAGPATFGLTEDDLRNHARELYRAGWSVDEITSVLDVQVAS